MRMSCVRFAAAWRYMPELLTDVLDGQVNLGRKYTCTGDLDGVSDAQVAMDECPAVKALIRVGW